LTRENPLETTELEERCKLAQEKKRKIEEELMAEKLKILGR
jgi:hypothetical protein